MNADLSGIELPTLVITMEESGVGTVERTCEWQEKIPNSRLLVLPGKSYHVAASDAEACAEATLVPGTGSGLHSCISVISPLQRYLVVYAISQA